MFSELYEDPDVILSGETFYWLFVLILTVKSDMPLDGSLFIDIFTGHDKIFNFQMQSPFFSPTMQIMSSNWCWLANC